MVKRQTLIKINPIAFGDRINFFNKKFCLIVPTDVVTGNNGGETMAKVKKKVNWEKLREKVRLTDKEVLKKVVVSSDGHTIYAPEQFTDLGLDKEVVGAFTDVIKSGSDPKEMIFGKNNELVKSVKGVHGLRLVEFIASVFDVTSWKMGRGSRAEHLSEQLVEKFNCTN